MRLRVLPCVLLAASAALAEDDLVRRAQVRLDHGNTQGAVGLLERALSKDADDGPALALLAKTDGTRDNELRLRYLERGRPLDLATAREFLGWLRGSVHDLRPEDVLALERASLCPLGSVEPCGPWLPWQRAENLPRATPPCGPLREEASGGISRRHSQAVARIEARFEREGVTDARCWSGLAVLQRTLGHGEAAERCLARATPVTAEERFAVAEDTLAVTGDPYGWWRRNGEALLGEVSAGASGSPDAYSLCREARRLLVEHHDLAGLMHLAIAEMERTRPLYDDWVKETLKAIAGSWRPDEVYEETKDLPGPGAACVRAMLLFEMLQDDLGFDLLEKVSREHPKYLPAKWLLYRKNDEMGALARSLRYARPLARALVERGQTEDRQLLLNYVELCHRFGDDAEADAVERRLPPTDEHYEVAWQLHKRAADAMDAGDIDLAMRLLDRASWSGHDVSYRNLVGSNFHAKDFHSWIVRLRGLATRRGLSTMQDEFVRDVFGPGEESRDRDVLDVRMRKEVEADPALLRLPGAAYLLSLLVDPQLEADLARRLRRQAYDSGFRSPGLLYDMAMDGEDVLPALAQADPVAGRLVAALRSQGTEALAAFLEEDAAWPEQLDLARAELRLRRRDFSTPPARETRGRYDGEGDLWDLVLHDPRRAEEVLERAHRLPAAAEPPANEPQDFDVLLERVDGLAIAKEFLGRQGSQAGRVFPALREQAAKHPLDLRWVDTEVEHCREWNSMFSPRPEAVEQLLAKRTRNARLISSWLLWAEGGEQTGRRVRAYLEARSGGRVQDLLVALKEPPQGGRNKTDRAAIFQALVPLCRDDADRNALAKMAAPELSAALDRGLVTSGYRDVRFDALLRARTRGVKTREPRASLALAEEADWSPEQRETLYANAASDAVNKGDAEVLAEAIEGCWRVGVPRAEMITRYLSYDHSKPPPADPHHFLALLAPRLQSGGGSDALWFFASQGLRETLPPELRALDLFGRAYDHGFVTRDEWEARALGSPKGEAPALCERLLEGRRTRREVFFCQTEVSSLARTLLKAGRAGEALACVDAWAKRCGPLDPVQRDPRAYEALWLRDYDTGGRAVLSYDSIVSAVPFQECIEPPLALAAILLDGTGCHAEAQARLRQAAREEWPPEVREECQRALAAISLRIALPDKWSRNELARIEARTEYARTAVPALQAILRGSESLDRRKDADAALHALYVNYSGARDEFVRTYLENLPAAPPAGDAEVRAWEARLGQEDAQGRQAAESDLRARGASAARLLRALAASSDPEVRGRAEAVLEDLAAP